MSLARGMRTRGSASCWRGCAPWWRRGSQNAVLRAELEAERELRRRLELWLEELERRLRSDSSDSGTPPSKEGIGARERRRAERADPDHGRRRAGRYRRQARPAGINRGPAGRGRAKLARLAGAFGGAA